MIRACKRHPFLRSIFVTLAAAAWLGASPAWAREKPKPAQPADSSAALVAANNQFAIDLYSRLRPAKNNILFSPYSLSAAMAMVFEGARGETADEIRAVFRFPADAAARQAAFSAIHQRLNASDAGFQLAAANALWAENDHRFLPAYFETLRQHYAAHAQNVDFRHAPQAARGVINRWVEARTGNRIKELLPPPSVTPLTRLVLTNALFFKGHWAQPFERNNTALADFHLSPTQTLKLPMMSRTGGRFKYLEDDIAQVLEMPYAGGQLSMLWVLPKHDLAALEKSLDAAQLQRWQSGLVPQRVDVLVPKFTARAEAEMKPTLAALGMPKVFSSSADFSGMNGERSLSLSEVFHQVFIEVSEEGSEAAAATAVVMERRLQPLPAVFRADRPLLFWIQDNSSGLILFFGRLADPRG